MSKFTDQLGNTIELPAIPKRIISLVPSQTELLHDLGLDEEVIGITKFCVHPEKWFHTKTRVGGTKTVNIEKARELQPDLIIANKEENVREQVEALRSIAPVWVSDVNGLDDALEMISMIGEMVGTPQAAADITKRIGDEFNNLPTAGSHIPTAYFIWNDPYMAAGGGTFINDMVQRCGFKNVFADRDRYPGISLEQLQTANPELILLSSEPYPFKEKHIEEFQTKIPGAKIALVDGEMFSWYGSRLQQAPGYFRELLAGL
jgi:ABC-type Fe3+-hydroxamate transport system substrate-binding protein